MSDDILSADVLDWIASESAFRGLWKSKELKDDGAIDEGWSVTYVWGGDYLEMPYQPTPLDAVNEARRRLAKHRATSDA